MTELGIWTIDNRKEKKLLRKKLADFNFQKWNKNEIAELIKKMKEIMSAANGIGLAANQIGLDARVFVAQLQSVDRQGQPRRLSTGERKFYAIFNPEIVKFSEIKVNIEEGCLSVPGGYYGEVDRPEKITLIGFDKNGKKLKIKAWGMLARVFQHEIDHLNGIVFVDKAKELHQYQEVRSKK